jgi:hypothetical protein
MNSKLIHLFISKFIQKKPIISVRSITAQDALTERNGRLGMNRALYS